MNKNAVIDTNIVVSAFISPNGKPAKILGMALNLEIQPFYCAEILAEYDEVLSRPKYNHSPEYRELIFRRILETWILIEPTKTYAPMPDETDRPFYDTARGAGAILITGNLKHYPASEPWIMTPADFIDIVCQID
jgi:putative PIN family toxin of toxin-antitoxin system